MKVYIDEDGSKRLIGRAEISEDAAYLDIPLFSEASSIVDRYVIGAVSTFDAAGNIKVERGVILAANQTPTLLPGWRALSS